MQPAKKVPVGEPLMFRRGRAGAAGEVVAAESSASGRCGLSRWRILCGAGADWAYAAAAVYSSREG